MPETHKAKLYSPYNKKLIVLIGASFYFLGIVGCSTVEPYTKIKYLKQFQAFATFINKNCGSFSTKDIQSIEATYLVLSEDLFNEFHGTLLENEKKLINTYRKKYLHCRSITSSGDIKFN